MNDRERTEPTVFVIFGAGGDLTWRKLVPALYNLYLDGQLPERSRSSASTAGTLSDEDVSRPPARRGRPTSPAAARPRTRSGQAFASRICYLAGDFTDAADRRGPGKARWQSWTRQWDAEPNRIFYLATPPTLVAPVAGQLNEIGLCRDCDRDRLVVEKPFGHDLASARSLDRTLTGALRREPDLPHRPLPGQGDGAEHPGLPLRQRPVRADLGPPLHRPRADHRGRDGRRRAPRRLLRPGRGPARHGAEPPAAAPLPDRHGAAGLLRRRRDPQQEGRRAARHPSHPPGEGAPLRGARPVRPRAGSSGETVPGYREEEEVAADSTTETFAALQALHRQLALAGRALLPAHRQAAAGQGLRGLHPLPARCRTSPSPPPRWRTGSPTGW